METYGLEEQSIISASRSLPQPLPRCLDFLSGFCNNRNV